MEKFGFVYLWRDKKRNKFYIGCHWGTEDDGYICSSKWMRDTYRYRANDFKRRVIQRVYTSRKDLLEVEHRWLSMIPDDHLGTRYYNLSKKHFGHWTAADNEKSVREKVSIGVRKAWTDGRMDDSTHKRVAALKRRRYTDKMRQVLIDRNKSPKTEEQRKNMKRMGEQNAWTGTMWINDGSTNQRVSKDTSIPAGFIKGRINVHKK